MRHIMECFSAGFNKQIEFVKQYEILQSNYIIQNFTFWPEQFFLIFNTDFYQK
jgi:hypothetical protein